MKSNLLSEGSLFNLHITKETWEDIKLYKEEYKVIIKQREMNRIPFVHRSPQSIYRRYVIEYLKKMAVKKHLTHCTLHLSIYILDIFMDNHSIATARILLVANACLLLAAKLEENNLTLPKIHELNAGFNHSFPLQDYKALEILILRFFHWNIMFPTAAHYTHYYMQAVLCIEDFDGKYITTRSLITEMHEFIRQYLDKIIDDVHYMQFYKPSKLASAIISIARDNIGLTSWTDRLVNLTTYSEQDLEETKQALLGPLPLKCNTCINKHI